MWTFWFFFNGHLRMQSCFYSSLHMQCVPLHISLRILSSVAFFFCCCNKLPNLAAYNSTDLLFYSAVGHHCWTCWAKIRVATRLHCFLRGSGKRMVSLVIWDIGWIQFLGVVGLRSVFQSAVHWRLHLAFWYHLYSVWGREPKTSNDGPLLSPLSFWPQLERLSTFKDWCA